MFWIRSVLLWKFALETKTGDESHVQRASHLVIVHKYNCSFWHLFAVRMTIIGCSYSQNIS